MTVLPITDIKPYWRNPRRNGDAVEAVKASIERYGFNQPIVVDDEHVIVVGHTRYKALSEMGVTEVPCVIVDLPADKAREYRIADNKTQEIASWDLDLLLPELQAIPDLEAFQVFFGDVDLGDLLHDAAGAGRKGPTQDGIDERTDYLGGRYEDEDGANETDMVEVDCPECGNAFFVSSAQVKTSADLQARRRAEQIAP